jgi:hypothetical protein
MFLEYKYEETEDISVGSHFTDIWSRPERIM